MASLRQQLSRETYFDTGDGLLPTFKEDRIRLKRTRALNRITEVNPRKDTETVMTKKDATIFSPDFQLRGT